METKDIILELRTKKGLSQEELAEKIFVTRQAVSRWENGETIPNTETLKLLSKEFDVSINTLLGSPRNLVCQCCGMPLEDSNTSREIDGFFNEEYCKWCYADGEYTYDNMDNDVTRIRQLGGYTTARKVSDIKLVITESSLKYLKFVPKGKSLEDGFRMWLNNLYEGKDTSAFGVVKTDQLPSNIREIMSEEKANQRERIVIYMDDIRQYYPRNMLPKDIVTDIKN